MYPSESGKDKAISGKGYYNLNQVFTDKFLPVKGGDMKRLSILIVLTIFALALVSPASAAGSKEEQRIRNTEKYRNHYKNGYEEEYEHVFKAKLRGEYEVPPVDTKAHGNFVAHINESYDSLWVNFVANSISNVTGAHIHLGGPAENGPAVATLYGPADPGEGRHNGHLFQGYLTAGDLIGPLEGENLSKLIVEMRDGNAYVNVHTDDGEGDTDTGPGDMSSGEIRGQIELKGMLPPAFARLQVIHNAADPAADTVDVYANGDLLLDDFIFRAATPFIDVPALVGINVGVAPGSSMSASDVIADFDVILDVNEAYVAIANGVLDPSAFAANPDTLGIGFTIFVKTGAREAATDPAMVDFFVLHGSTDAPTVDVIARDVAKLVDDAAYGDMTDYISVPPNAYILDITPGGDDTLVVASFDADLSGLGGGAAAVFASGFFDPSLNGDGPAFGLFAALPNGTVVEFPAHTDSTLGYSSRGAEAGIVLRQNYPNPFNPSTMISFFLPQDAHVKLKVYDVNGREVATVIDGVRPAGDNQAVLKADMLQSGVYFYRLSAGNKVVTKKMIILR